MKEYMDPSIAVAAAPPAQHAPAIVFLPNSLSERSDAGALSQWRHWLANRGVHVGAPRENHPPCVFTPPLRSPHFWP